MNASGSHARQNTLSRMTDYRRGTGMSHPLLGCGAGAVTLVAACTTAGDALALTLCMLLMCVGMAVVYFFERGEYIQPMRSLVYLAPSALLACFCGLAVQWASPAAAARIGMYLPLLAVDALVLARMQPDAPFVPPTDALPEALRLWWLYAVMALPLGIVREWLGGGTVFGKPFLFTIGMQGMHRPFAGFLLLGFLLAACNAGSGGNTPHSGVTSKE